MFTARCLRQSTESCLGSGGLPSSLPSAMAPALCKPSFLRSVVVVTCYLVICVNELGVVRCEGAPAYPPAESPVSSAPTPTSIESPAFSGPLFAPSAPALDPSQYPDCGPWPEKFQAYESEAMLSLAKAWKLSSQFWNESVHPCEFDSAWFSGWIRVYCRAILVDHNDTKGTVCEIFVVTLYRDLDFYMNEIIGELVPEIGDLRNLEYISLPNNPGLTGPIPASIWNLPNLKHIDLSRNSLSGSVVFNYTMSSTTSLEYIDLSFNSLTSWEVNTSTTLLRLQALYLHNNSLSESFSLVSYMDGNGILPLYYSLETLELSNNYLKDLIGQDPTQYVTPFLKTLNLSSNLITGFSNNLVPLSINYSTVDFSPSVLDLSNNQIGGDLPDWSSVLRGPSTLSNLILDNNSISGEFDISAFVASDFSKSLTILSLKDNNITNVVYAHDFAGVRTKFLLQGNPYCNSTWTSAVDAFRCSIYCERNCTYENPKTDSGKSWTIIVAATTSSSTLLLLLATLCFAFVLRRNKKYIRALQKKIRKADIKAKRFEYGELRVATKNFAPEMKLGAGAYGAVYKGILPNNNVVAVKQLFLETHEGRDDFLNEVLLISNLQHRNLVNLKGYCLHAKQTLLVYEYVDNYDLDKLLFSSHNSTDNTQMVSPEVLNWQARMKVCQGVAQGLYYLHASSQSRIIHRDIKASNIMLDKNLHPKIADFGLARPIEDARSVIVTQQCAGTLGYLAPEYMFHGQLSEKADVYSFGVLLLEIVSGKRNRDFTMPDDEVYLPTRAWKLHKGDRLLDMKDAALVVSEDEVLEVLLVLETAVLCVQNAPDKRPSMFQVAAKLAGDANIDAAPVEDEYDSWADLSVVTLVESDSCENPLFTSCTSGVSGTAGPHSSCNAKIELTMLHASR